MRFRVLAGLLADSTILSSCNYGSLFGSMGINTLPSIPGMPSLPDAGGSSQPGGGQSATGSGMMFLTKEWAVRGGDILAQKQCSLSVNVLTGTA